MGSAMDFQKTRWSHVFFYVSYIIENGIFVTSLKLEIKLYTHLFQRLNFEEEFVKSMGGNLKLSLIA